MTEERANHCTMYHKGFVYVFGGQNSEGALDSWEAFDMNSNEWIPLPEMPNKRFNASWCKFDTNEVYVFGGCQLELGGEDDDQNLDAIDVYSFNAEWTTLQLNLQKKLQMVVCLQIGRNKIIVMGGKEGNGIWSKDVTILDVSKNKWEDEESLELPWYSIYPPVYKGDTVYIQNSGTELDGCPDPMIYPYSKLA